MLSSQICQANISLVSATTDNRFEPLTDCFVFLCCFFPDLEIQKKTYKDSKGQSKDSKQKNSRRKLSEFPACVFVSRIQMVRNRCYSNEKVVVEQKVVRSLRRCAPQRPIAELRLLLRLTLSVGPILCSTSRRFSPCHTCQAASPAS
jgi:hypothetical protein